MTRQRTTTMELCGSARMGECDGCHHTRLVEPYQDTQEDSGEWDYCEECRPLDTCGECGAALELVEGVTHLVCFECVE